MLLMLLDAALVCLSFIFAYYLRFRVLIFITPTSIPEIELYLRPLVFAVLIWLAILNFAGLYDPKKVAPIDQAASAFIGGAFSGVFLVGLMFLYREYWFSRLLLIYAWLLSFGFISASRYMLEIISGVFKKIGYFRKNVVVFGTSSVARNFVEKIKKNKGIGYDIIFYFDDKSRAKKLDGIKVFNSFKKIKKMVVDRDIDVMVFDSKEILSTEKVLDIISEYETKDIEFKVIPGVLEIMESRVELDAIGGMPLVTIAKSRLTGFNLLLKRIFDFVFSLILVIISSPLMLLIALAIKIDSDGPVLFRQKRIGRGGKPFKMFKFRSMVKGAERLGTPLSYLYKVEGKTYKRKDDPRITRVGKLLRKFSLDELPQLLNVVTGEMSLVGPRPKVEAELEEYGSYYEKLMITPGITGLWQVSGRAELSFEDRIRLDIYYIENWSLWLDLKILLRTVPAVFSTGGAY